MALRRWLGIVCAVGFAALLVAADWRVQPSIETVASLGNGSAGRYALHAKAPGSYRIWIRSDRPHFGVLRDGRIVLFRAVDLGADRWVVSGALGLTQQPTWIRLPEVAGESAAYLVGAEDAWPVVGEPGVFALTNADIEPATSKGSDPGRHARVLQSYVPQRGSGSTLRLDGEQESIEIRYESSRWSLRSSSSALRAAGRERPLLDLSGWWFGSPSRLPELVVEFDGDRTLVFVDEHHWTTLAGPLRATHAEGFRLHSEVHVPVLDATLTDDGNGSWTDEDLYTPEGRRSVDIFQYLTTPLLRLHADLEPGEFIVVGYESESRFSVVECLEERRVRLRSFEDRAEVQRAVATIPGCADLEIEKAPARLSVRDVAIAPSSDLGKIGCSSPPLWGAGSSRACRLGVRTSSSGSADVH